MDLTKQIEQLKTDLKTPNHFFSRTADKDVMIYFEGEDISYEFRGNSMKLAVEEGINFVKENFQKVDKKQLNLFKQDESK